MASNKITTVAKLPMVKRARFDAMPQTTQVEDLATLRAELEAATKSIEQLRREKDYEVGRVREQEQTSKALALKDLASEFHRQKQRELEQLRESLRQRFEAESVKAARRYDRNIIKLTSDLDRCQNALRDEVEKRGLSSSTRAGLEAERARLLQELRELGAAKRKAEEALQATVETDRQRTAEMRRLQEACKMDVARVTREANAEVRKLLEELKTKDHQLALLDRNLYVDRGGGSSSKLHQQQQSGADNDETKNPAASLTDNKPNNTDETVERLKAEVDRLTNQVVVSETERVGLKVRVDELRKEVSQRAEVIKNLQHQLQEKQGKTDKTIRCQQKSVRFLLPGATLPVMARELSVSSDDDSQSICSDISELTSISSDTSLISAPDTTTTFFYDESVEKNYRMLLSEHVTLQRSVAFLLTLSSLPTIAVAAPSTTPSPAPSAAPVLAIQDKQPTCPQGCITEKEDLKATVEALKDKLLQSEESEQKLQLLLQEQQEQNEELEFRLFEFENCPEKAGTGNSDTDTVDEWIEKSQRLEIELSMLKNRLSQYELLEMEISSSCGLNLPQFITSLRQKNELANRELETARSEVAELRIQLQSLISGDSAAGRDRVAVLRESTKDMLDSEDDSLCPMTCSMSSATSGFDDNSCDSSVVDLKLDDMPTEEAWGCDMSEEEVEAEMDASGRIRESSTPLTNEIISESCCHAEGQFMHIDEVREIEQSWAKRVEALEQRLQQSVNNEHRAKDQLALLSEEKDRRIVALQDQVDVLEANEFRLAETIQSLEQLEQTLSGHVTGSPLGSLSSEQARDDAEVFNEPTEKNTGCDAVITYSETDNSRTAAEKRKYLKLDLTSCDGRNDSADDDVRFCCKLEKCFRRDACIALKNTIRQLTSALQVHELLDKRVLDTEQNSVSCKEESRGRVCSVAVDFQADYQELESLVKELKNVLFSDNTLRVEASSSAGGEGDMGKAGIVSMSGQFDVQIPIGPDNVWTCCDNCCSLPTSPEYEGPRTPSDVIELELTEQYLRNQISDLEKERDHLYSVSCRTDEALRKLRIQYIELQSSDQSQREEVSRLKAKEDWLTGRIDDLMELVARLEDTVRTHQATESELKSRMERHQASESDLHRELENMAEEMHSDGMKLRRRLTQLEDERDSLAVSMDVLTERNSDLEGRELELVCKIKKMEAVETGLRKEVSDLQKALSVLGYEGQTDCLLHTYASLEESRAAVSIELRQHRDEILRLGEMVVFLKESVESYKQCAADLEVKLRECAGTEQILRDTVTEYERIDQIWQDKVHHLEESLAQLTDKLQQVETELNECKSRSLDFTSRTAATTDQWTQQTAGDADDLLSLRDAVKGLVLLSEVASDADLTEWACWAAIENTPSDDVTEIEVDMLTSPHWAEVEAYMGLGDDTSSMATTERKCVSEDSACVTSPTLESNPLLETSTLKRSTVTEGQAPPLPLSPPPDSPGTDRRGSSLQPTDELHQRERGLAPGESRDFMADRRGRAASEGPSDVISNAKLNTAQKMQFSASVDLTTDTSADRSKPDILMPLQFSAKQYRQEGSHVDALVHKFSEQIETANKQQHQSQIPRWKIPPLRQSSTPSYSVTERSRSMPNGATSSVKAARSSLPVITSSMLPTLKLDAVTSGDKRTKSGYSPELQSRTLPSKSYLPRYVGINLKSPTSSDRVVSSPTRSPYLRVSLSSDVSESRMDSSASALHPASSSDSKVPLSGLRG